VEKRTPFSTVPKEICTKTILALFSRIMNMNIYINIKAVFTMTPTYLTFWYFYPNNPLVKHKMFFKRM